MNELLSRVAFNSAWTDALAQQAALRITIADLRADVMKWKATVEEADAALRIMQRDRDYWQEQAMRGGDGQAN